MKYLICLSALFLISQVSAQKVFSTQYSNQADCLGLL